jgi:low temperature requirement protein LtrA
MTPAKHSHPPRLYTQVAGEDEHEEHKATWLELFYDLIYVMALINLGHALSEDVSLFGFLRFVLLFIPIWWSWTGATFYINRFTSDDVWQRLLIFIQIFAIAVLGTSVHAAWESLGIQFTIAYVAIRLVLVVLYFRAAQHVEEARELSIRYGTGFFIASMIWLLAIFVPQAYRPYVWLVGMVVDFLVPLSRRSQALTRKLPFDVPHLAERYGLFTIIVLGESFVKFDAETLVPMSFPMLIYGILAVSISCLLWWIYFEDISEAKLQPTSRAAYVWVYSHLPIAFSLISFGVGAYKLMGELEESHAHIEYLWLTGISMILYLTFIGLIDAVTVRAHDGISNTLRSGIRLGGAVLILLLTLFGTDLTSTQYIGFAAIIFIVDEATVHIVSQRNAVMSEPSATS